MFFIIHGASTPHKMCFLGFKGIFLSENFAAIMNTGSGDNVFWQFSFHMTSNQLDALLAEMETVINIPENIPKAVSVVGKTITPSHVKYGSSTGNTVKPEDHGFLWTGHLVKDPHNETANKEQQVTINLPLLT